MIDQIATQERLSNPLFTGLCSSITGSVIGAMFTNVTPVTAGIFTSVSILLYGPIRSVTTRIFVDDEALEKITTLAIQAIASTFAALLITNQMGYPISTSSAIWLGILYTVSQIALRSLGYCCVDEVL